MLMGELLRDPSAPRNTCDIYQPVPELSDKASGEPCECRRPVRQGWKRRAPDAGHVEGDRFGSVERINEGLDQLDVGTDPIEQQQRRTRLVAGTNADPQLLSADVAQADLQLFLHYVSAGRRAERG